MTPDTETDDRAPEAVDDGAVFYLLDPMEFRTAKAARAFVRSDAFGALLAAISASTCPSPDPLPEGVERLATSKVWLIAEDLKKVCALAQHPPSTTIVAALDDAEERLRLLSLFAAVLAHSDESRDAFELYRMAWGDDDA